MLLRAALLAGRFIIQLSVGALCCPTGTSRVLAVCEQQQIPTAVGPAFEIQAEIIFVFCSKR
jgi:hypothetical protein